MGAQQFAAVGWSESPEVAVAHQLAAHDGVITTAEALACGFTEGQIRSRVRRGLWLRQARGVFFSVEHPFGEAARLRTVAAAHGATVDRASAAWWHGLLSEPPAQVTASIPRSAKPDSACTVAADLSRRTYPAEDLTTVHGVAVTGPALSLLGAAAMVGDGLDLLDRAIQTGSLTVPELTAALDRNSGVHGLGTARKLLKIASGASEFEAERLFVRMLRDERITGWTQQVSLCGYRYDFVWPAERIAVEIHGYRFHRMESRWNRDLRKSNAIAGIGWLPLAYSWKQLTQQPERCLREIARALAFRRAELG